MKDKKDKPIEIIFEKFYSEATGISMSYPKGWVSNTVGKTRTIFPADGKVIKILGQQDPIISPSINVQMGKDPNSNFDQIYNGIISNQHLNYKDYKKVEIENHLDKKIWMIEFKKQNNAFKAIYLLKMVNDTIILLNCSCIISDFNKWESIFKTIVSSVE